MIFLTPYSVSLPTIAVPNHILSVHLILYLKVTPVARLLEFHIHKYKLCELGE